MADLTETQRATFERYAGPVADADEAGVAAKVARLGSAYGAALEVLMINRADMRRSATKVRSADDTVDHTANLAAMNQAVTELLDAIAAAVAGGTLQLSTTEQALLAEASGPVVGSGLNVVARSPRRG